MRTVLVAVLVLGAALAVTNGAAAQPPCEPSCAETLDDPQDSVLSALAPFLLAGFALRIAPGRER